MPSFRERPLTWLFLIATACVDLAAWGAGEFESWWLQTLIFAQLLVLGGWTALGRSHRLARAGVFVGVILALAAPDILNRHNSEMINGYVLAMMIVLASLAAAAACTWRAVLRLFLKQSSPRNPSFWRFSVIEMLGWMIVAAGAAKMLRGADFRALETLTESGAALVLTVILAATTLMMTLGLDRLAGGVTTTLAALGAIALLAVAVLQVASGRQSAAAMAAAFAYVAAWVLVQRMDESRQCRGEMATSN